MWGDHTEPHALAIKASSRSHWGSATGSPLSLSLDFLSEYKERMAPRQASLSFSSRNLQPNLRLSWVHLPAPRNPLKLGL